MSHLKPKEKKHVKVIVILAVTGLLLEKVSEKSTRVKEGGNPAVTHIGAQIDEFLKPYPESRRNELIKRINTIRVRLTKNIGHLQIENAFVGALEVLTDEKLLKTKVGTRLDFIVGNFRTNLANIKENLPINEKEVAELRKHLLSALRQV